MKYKYQLIILGDDADSKNYIISNVYKKIEELGLSKEILNLINSRNALTDYLGNQPAFALYFGNNQSLHNDLDITSKLLKDGTMILPIYFNDFLAEIPDILHNQNGIKYEETQVDRITNIILESFELLRNTRRIFISYKRSESTSIAIQLYEALEFHNFDVFLDTHSIGKGEPFQEELWHRMSDCDVMIILNTPQYLESHWCKEEFAEAGTKQIGIIQLIWPNHEIKNIDSSSHLSFPFKLKKTDFFNDVFDNKDTSKLIDSKISEIIQNVESVRARNLAARQDNLITTFKNIANECGRNITLQPERFLTEDLESGKRVIYIPTIGIPQTTSCQSAEIRHEIDVHCNISIRLIYDDLRIRDKWLKHLDWLNNNFKKDILTLKKQEFKSWLQKIK